MEVFLSWSKPRSKEVALVLRPWLQSVVQALRPWMSETDIDRGSRGLQEIAEHLSRAEFGIICVTPENKDEPWLLFEAGALSKSVDRARVCPVLFDLEPHDLTGPLSQFQAARFERDDMLALVRSINETWDEQDMRLATSLLDESFEERWPRLEKALQGIPNRNRDANEPTDRQLLAEIREQLKSIADASANPASAFERELTDAILVHLRSELTASGKPFPASVKTAVTRFLAEKSRK